jgi:hypothetical protein
MASTEPQTCGRSERGVQVGIEAVRAALLLGAAFALFHALPLSDASAKRPGRELVAEYDVPAERIAQWRARLDGTPAAARADARKTFDPELWLGPQQPTGAGRNPYTLVLRVAGVALAAGDVRTHWHAGWEVQESPTIGRDVLMPVAALSSGSVRAGTPVTLTAIGLPLTFRGERSAAPMLSLLQARNLEIQSVHVAVWSGPAPWLSLVPMTATHVACLGLALLCALAWHLTRRVTPLPTRASAAAMATSTMPPSIAVEPLPLNASKIRAARRLPQASLPAAVGSAKPASHAARVVAALGDVLGRGLTFVNELDEARGRRHRRGGLHPG